MVGFFFASMPPWVLIACMLSIAFLCFKSWQVHPRYGKNIGPPVFPLVGSFISLVRNQHRLYDWAAELLRRSPSLTTRNVLFGIELYTTANPANVEYVLKTNFRNYTKGIRFQSLMQDMLGHGILNADGELWKAQRKAASYEFTSNSLKTLIMETVQKEISDRLLPVLYASCESTSSETSDNTSCTPMCAHGDSHCARRSLHTPARTHLPPPVDLQDIFLRFAFDNVCQIALGVDPACLNSSMHNGGFAKAFDDATELTIQRFFLPAWIWKLKRFLNLGAEKKFRKALHVVHNFTMEVIQRRKAEFKEAQSHVNGDSRNQQQSDLLVRLLGVATQIQDGQSNAELRSKASEDKHAVAYASGEADGERAERKSDEFLRDMIISFLIAGRDSSSIALTWFFWLLTVHPHVEASIYEEITRVVQARKTCRYAGAAEHPDSDHDMEQKNLIKKEGHKMMCNRGGSDVHEGDGHDDMDVGDGHAHDMHVGDDHAHDMDVNAVNDGSNILMDADHVDGADDTMKESHGNGDDDGDVNGMLNAGHVDGDDGDHVNDMLNAGHPDVEGHNVGCDDDISSTTYFHDDDYKPFTYEELKEMKYLQAALQEAMRLYPPVPHDTKFVVEEDVFPDGTRVRAGAQMVYHVYAMGRMQSIWGEDCESFRPERWLEEEGENAGGLVNMSPYKWPVFQAGPRSCLGKEMAMLQMKCVASALIQSFTFSLPDAANFSPSYSVSFTLKMQHGLPIHVHPRSSI
eukprot:c24449_g4_i1 orf=210-2444(-)